MIDTIRFRLRAGLRGGFSRAEWNYKETRIHTPKGPLPIRELTHKTTGVRITLRDGWLYAQASLPRVLFGTNRKMVFTPKQLSEALAKTLRLLKRILSIHGSKMEFTRVDLVWQIRINTKRFLYAHQNLRHPELHSLPVSYHGESLLWRGTGMSISAYDKVLKETGKRGHVMRVEVRLTKEKLKRELGKGVYPMGLDLAECYRCFREKILRFVPKPVLRLTKKTDFYALAAQEKWAINGVPVIDLLLDELDQTVARRIRRAIAGHQLTAYRIFWRRLLRKRLPSKVSVFQGCDVSLPLKFIFPKLRPPRPHQVRS